MWCGLLYWVSLDTVQHPGVLGNDPPVGCKLTKSACCQALGFRDSLSHICHTHMNEGVDYWRTHKICKIICLMQSTIGSSGASSVTDCLESFWTPVCCRATGSVPLELGSRGAAIGSPFCALRRSGRSHGTAACRNGHLEKPESHGRFHYFSRLPYSGISALRPSL